MVRVSLCNNEFLCLEQVSIVESLGLQKSAFVKGLRRAEYAPGF